MFISPKNGWTTLYLEALKNNMTNKFHLYLNDFFTKLTLSLRSQSKMEFIHSE